MSRWVQNALPFDPVDGEAAWLPASVDHGTLNAYGHYKCRCEPCKSARRSYDRDVWERKNRTREYRERKAQYDRDRRSK